MLKKEISQNQLVEQNSEIISTKDVILDEESPLTAAKRGKGSSMWKTIEFLKMKNELEIDLIILDMEMPKMNGVDLLEALTEPISVLVISSKPEYAIDVINHNVIGYLLKPLKFVDFMKTMDKVKLIKEKPNTEQINYATLNYLLHQYSISYAFSSTMLVQQKGSLLLNKKLNYGGFAPVYSSGKISDTSTLINYQYFKKGKYIFMYIFYFYFNYYIFKLLKLYINIQLTANVCGSRLPYIY